MLDPITNVLSLFLLTTTESCKGCAKANEGMEILITTMNLFNFIVILFAGGFFVQSCFFFLGLLFFFLFFFFVLFSVFIPSSADEITEFIEALGIHQAGTSGHGILCTKVIQDRIHVCTVVHLGSEFP